MLPINPIISRGCCCSSLWSAERPAALCFLQLMLEELKTNMFSEILQNFAFFFFYWEYPCNVCNVGDFDFLLMHRKSQNAGYIGFSTKECIVQDGL